MNKDVPTHANYTDEITCPYCGHEFQDSWDYNLTEDRYEVVECAECGMPFSATVNHITSYSSRAKVPGDE